MVLGAGRSEELFRKLNRLIQLDSEDCEAMLAWPAAERSVRAEDVLIDEGAETDSCVLLLSGVLARIKLTPDGRRQIVSFHHPGDLLDLQSLFFRKADHGVQAVTAARVLDVPKTAIMRTLRERWKVAEALWRDTLLDASVFREWVLNLGRRDARSRIAHLLCEIEARLSKSLASSQLRSDGFYFPVTQEDIADATGLTSVHVNRTLRSLREEGALEYRSGRITILDRERMVRIAQFDPTYLHQLG